MTSKITGLLAALMIGQLFRFKRQDIAINAVAEAPPDPALAVGLPTGVSSTAVAARKAALMAAGTPAIYAEKLAVDAEQQQAWHDNPKMRTEGQSLPGTPAEREAAAIREAQSIEKSKLKVPSEKKLDERQDVVDQAGAASAQTAGVGTSNEEANR